MDKTTRQYKSNSPGPQQQPPKILTPRDKYEALRRAAKRHSQQHRKRAVRSYLTYDSSMDLEAYREFTQRKFFRSVSKVIAQRGLNHEGVFSSTTYRSGKEALARMEESANTSAEDLIALAYVTHELVQSFGHFALGSKHCAELFVSSLTSAVNLLNELPEEVLQECARSRSAWPCMVSLQDLASYDKKTGFTWRRHLTGIQLGQATKPVSIQDTIANQSAWMLWWTVKENRRLLADKRSKAGLPEWVLAALRLEPLHEQTWKSWFEVGWMALRHKFNGNPETDPTLAQLGSHRRKHTQTATDGSATQRSNIRDGIKRRLRTAFALQLPLFSDFAE